MSEKKELYRTSRESKTIGYFELMSSALNIKTNNKIEKRKLNIAIEVLHDVSVTYAETKEFIYDNSKRNVLKKIYLQER